MGIREDKSKNNSKSEENTANDHLLKFCETRMKTFRWWAKFDWWFYNWLNAIQIIIMIAVPFILIILLYVSDKNKLKINLLVLFLSGIGTILNVLNLHFHFENRSKLSREIYTGLSLAHARYTDGDINRKEFFNEIKELFYKQDIAE